MADCASLLDEEFSSFVFNYLTENSGSQFGEEEVSSGRLDADFPDFDLSQLDASDFDSVNCLGELPWCNEQSDQSPASIQYSAGDPELFEEENAALLAALTDSLDGIVEDGVGGLSVFPSLGEDPDEGEEDEDDLDLDSEPLTGSLSPETEDPSLLKKLLLSPPNVPVSLETHKNGSAHRHSSRILHVKPARPVLKKDKTSTQDRRLRPVRPAGRLCTELHRHLTTAQEAEDTPSADEEEEEEEDSDSEEEEEESSSSEGESTVCVEPPKPQFTSEKELHSVVELIKYMHTYCVPTRKQAGWDRKEREAQARKAKSENSQVSHSLPQNSHKPTPQNCNSGASRPRVPFTRRREIKAHSLLKELLEAVSSFDVSKPYRMHSPPYSHGRGDVAQPDREVISPSARQTKAEPRDCESSQKAPKRPKSPEPEEGSFSVRRSRRLASFPSRFAKRVRVSCDRSERSTGHFGEEENAVKHPPIDDPDSQKINILKSPGTHNPCCSDEKRACLCLPLASKSNGDTQYATKSFEQTLCMELCGTAGLTPPTTPPHKPVEDELFKPDGKAEITTKSSCLARAHIRKLPEQTELYAQLRRMDQTGDAECKGGTQRAYGDHDYCLLGLGESRKRTAAVLGTIVPRRKIQESNGVMEGQGEKLVNKMTEYQQRTEAEEELQENQTAALPTLSPEQTSEPTPACSPTQELDAQSPVSCSPPSPGCKISFSSESSETCHETSDKRSKIKCGQENDVNKCQVIYIHNLPSSVTQSMLRKRFEALGHPEVVIKDEERCGVITLRPSQNGPTQRHRWDSVSPGGGNGSRRFGRKRYIDLDEAGPGPVKSKYDALDFDALLKEAQRSLHR